MLVEVTRDVIVPDTSTLIGHTMIENPKGARRQRVTMGQTFRIVALGR